MRPFRYPTHRAVRKGNTIRHSLGYGGRVGGRYVLSSDHGDGYWLTTSMPTHDQYPSEVEHEDNPELAHKLDEAVADLPDELRDVVEAVDIACLSQREAGRMLGIDHKTVGRRLKRAHELLAAAIDEQADE